MDYKKKKNQTGGELDLAVGCSFPIYGLVHELDDFIYDSE